MKNILDKINKAYEIQANLELDKTELGTHEVELALVDNIKELSKKYMPLWAKANSELASANVNLKAALDITNQAEQLLNKGIQQVKELGLSDSFFADNLNIIKEEKSKINSLLNKIK